MRYVLSVSDVVPSGIFDSIFPILQMGGVALGLILMLVGAFRLFSPDPFSGLYTSFRPAVLQRPGRTCLDSMAS